MNTQSSAPPALQAAVQVLQPTFAALSTLFGLSALIFAVGWKELEAYYAAFGAAWILPTLPTSNVASAGASLIVTVLVITLLSLYQFSMGAASSRGLRRASLGTLAVGAALCTVPLYLETTTPTALYALTIIGSALIAAPD